MVPASPRDAASVLRRTAKRPAMLPRQQKIRQSGRKEKGMRPPRPTPHDDPMDDELVERFLEDGFVKIEGAFPPRVAQHCASLLWRGTGYDPPGPASREDPVGGVAGRAQGPSAPAVNTPVLHEALDLLVGENRWQSRYSLGTFPLRFPHAEEPDDAGWHIEGSSLPEDAPAGMYHTNLRSRDRAL